MACNLLPIYSDDLLVKEQGIFKWPCRPLQSAGEGKYFDKETISVGIRFNHQVTALLGAHQPRGVPWAIQIFLEEPTLLAEAWFVQARHSHVERNYRQIANLSRRELITRRNPWILNALVWEIPTWWHSSVRIRPTKHAILGWRPPRHSRSLRHSSNIALRRLPHGGSSIRDESQDNRGRVTRRLMYLS